MLIAAFLILFALIVVVGLALFGAAKATQAFNGAMDMWEV